MEPYRKRFCNFFRFIFEIIVQIFAVPTCNFQLQNLSEKITTNVFTSFRYTSVGLHTDYRTDET